MLSQTEPVPPLLGQEDGEWPVRFHPGTYLLTYDIREDRRLRRVQKASAKVCAFLQRSVYLYQGGGGLLARLLSEVGELIEHKVDDVRVYPLNAAEDLWFLCGPPPPLAGFDGPTDPGRHPFEAPWEAQWPR